MTEFSLRARGGLYLLSIVAGVALAAGLTRAQHLGLGARPSLESLAPEGVTLVFDPTDCLLKRRQIDQILREVYARFDRVALVVLRPPTEEDRVRVLASFGLDDVEQVIFDERGEWNRIMSRMGSGREGVWIITRSKAVRIIYGREVLSNGIVWDDGRTAVQDVEGS